MYLTSARERPATTLVIPQTRGMLRWMPEHVDVWLTHAAGSSRTVKTCQKVRFLQTPRAILIAIQYGVPIKHFARQLERQDFKDFDYILASDNQVRGVACSVHLSFS